MRGRSILQSICVACVQPRAPAEPPNTRAGRAYTAERSLLHSVVAHGGHSIQLNSTQFYEGIPTTRGFYRPRLTPRWLAPGGRSAQRSAPSSAGHRLDHRRPLGPLPRNVARCPPPMPAEKLSRTRPSPSKHPRTPARPDRTAGIGGGSMPLNIVNTKPTPYARADDNSKLSSGSSSPCHQRRGVRASEKSVLAVLISP